MNRTNEQYVAPDSEKYAQAESARTNERMVEREVGKLVVVSYRKSYNEHFIAFYIVWKVRGGSC